MDHNIRQRVHSIVAQMDPRTASGDTLLHLSVAKNNTLKSQNLFEDGAYAFFPSCEVARLLVECGGKVNAVNKSNSTPLHTAAAPGNYQQQVCFPFGLRFYLYFYWGREISGWNTFWRNLSNTSMTAKVLYLPKVLYLSQVSYLPGILPDAGMLPSTTSVV